MMNTSQPYIGIYRKAFDVNLPKIQTRGSACFDLEAYITPGTIIKGFNQLNEEMNMYTHDYSLALNPGDRFLVPTGLIFDIPTGYSVRIHNRSSLPLKKGLVLANAEGVIDSDYVEEIFVILQNTTQAVVHVVNGDRIAQGELIKNITQELFEIADRPSRKTDRQGGFGSTGSNSVTSIYSQVSGT